MMTYLRTLVWIVCTSLYWSKTCSTYQGYDQVFEVTLDSRGLVTLHWTLDYTRNEVQFEVHFPVLEKSWFALGFSDYGEVAPADYCVLWTDWKNRQHFEDTWAYADGILSRDESQDCNNFRSTIHNGIFKFAFSRKFDTCDVMDYIIEDGTTHIVWSCGNGPLYRLDGLSINGSHVEKGMVRVQLLKNVQVNQELAPNTWHHDILADAVHVPAGDTTYWCHVHRLPRELEVKQHVVQFESVIQQGNEGLVHHMEVFHCEAPVNEEMPNYQGSCFDAKRPNKTQVCKKVIAAWAMGAPPFIYPEEAGFPIGGPEFNPFVMLEVHYNNPEERADWIDSSGIRLSISPKLRKYNAGVIELGLEYIDKMAIPPGQNEFSLSGYCIMECTAVGLPSTGIVIFGSQLHTHLTGIRVHTRHIRNGQELPELNRDNHYSTHFQEIRRLKRPVRILPGDALITTCGYRTENRENITLGGFAITDEMCVNYVHYYPEVPLEVCKSSINDHSLQAYFRFLRDNENQNTGSSKGISDNYNSVEWTPLRAEMLLDLYGYAPLAMQCNMSGGDRFPGYWGTMPVTKVLLPLPPPIRHCPGRA